MSATFEKMRDLFKQHTRRRRKLGSTCGSLEFWLTTEDTDALERELLEPGAAIDTEILLPTLQWCGIRSQSQLLGYPARWDMPETAIVIIG